MSDWKMPAGVKKHPLPPEAVLGASSVHPVTTTKKPRTAAGRAKREKVLTPGQIKWRAQKAKSDAAAAEFKRLCVARGLPLPTREFMFAKEALGREWEADFAWPEEKVCLEVEGGAHTGGRHTRGSGYLEDMVKYNTMTVLGYRLIRTTPKMLCSEETITNLLSLMPR